MELTPEQTKVAIAAKRIGAITLDTSVIDANKAGFEHGVLARMRQFLDGPVSFVLSDVVLGEVKRHVVQNAKDAEAKVRASLKAVGGTWQITSEQRTKATHALFGGESAEQMATRRLGAFSKATGLVKIDSSGLVDVGALLQDYFSAQPPFGVNEPKKSEFPDAIALRALEAWARLNKTLVLTVSKDGDWKRYCRASDVLVNVEDLGDALSYFHANAEFVSTAISKMVRDGSLDLTGFLISAIDRQVDRISFVPECSSRYFYEAELFDIATESVKLEPLDATGNELFKPIYQDDGFFEAEVTAIATLRVGTSFRFWVDDHTDRDQTRMGSATASKSVQVPIRAVFSFEGDLVHAPEVADVDVELGPYDKWIDYGELNPYDDDDW